MPATTTVQVTVTPAEVLRQAMKRTAYHDTELTWDRMARGVDELGYAVVPKPQPTEDAVAETARVLSRAVTDAAKRAALATPSYAVPGVLNTTPVHHLMPEVVEALLWRPDLLRALLAERTDPDHPLVGVTITGAEADALPVGSVIHRDIDGLTDDISRRTRHETGWFPAINAAASYRVVTVARA